MRPNSLRARLDHVLELRALGDVAAAPRGRGRRGAARARRGLLDLLAACARRTPRARPARRTPARSRGRCRGPRRSRSPPCRRVRKRSSNMGRHAYRSPAARRAGDAQEPGAPARCGRRCCRRRRRSRRRCRRRRRRRRGRRSASRRRARGRRRVRPFCVARSGCWRASTFSTSTPGREVRPQHVGAAGLGADRVHADAVAAELEGGDLA